MKWVKFYWFKLIKFYYVIKMDLEINNAMKNDRSKYDYYSKKVSKYSSTIDKIKDN